MKLLFIYLCDIDKNWAKMRKRFTVVDSGMTCRTWAVNKRRQIFTYLKGRWHRVAGGLKHISSGQAGVWGVSGSGYVYYRMAVTAKKPKGRYWKRVSGRLTQIDSGPSGTVCGVNKHNNIYCRTQVTSRYRRGRRWVRVPGKLKYITCGEYGYWGVNKANNIYFRQGVSRGNPVGLKWRRVAGKLRQIEAGKFGQVWGVNPSGRVYVRTGISAARPWGAGWKYVKTRKSWRHITIGIGAVFGVATNGRVYRTAPATAGNLFQQFYSPIVIIRDLKIYNVTNSTTCFPNKEIFMLNKNQAWIVVP